MELLEFILSCRIHVALFADGISGSELSGFSPMSELVARVP